MKSATREIDKPTEYVLNLITLQNFVIDIKGLFYI